MSDTTPGCEISKKNAREFAATAPLAQLQAWQPCGCEGCTFCSEVSIARAERLAPKPPPPPVDRNAATTTDGRPVDDVRTEQLAEGNKLHKSYIVLSDAERAKGFVRPVRRSYIHVGSPEPENLRDLTPEEKEKYASFAYVKWRSYGPERAPVTGRYYTQHELDRVGKGCGSTTTMSQPIAETYARDPSFYGSTYCATCGQHYRVGEEGEFIWDDAEARRDPATGKWKGARVGT